MRVIIAGGRDFDDLELAKLKLDKILKDKMSSITIVSGGAKGADSIGETYAWLRGRPCIVIKANWDLHGKSAGYIRNKQMAETSDALIAFWDGKSKGTGHMIDLAKSNGLLVRVIRY